MGPIYCDECGRANGAAAKKCIWCGLPIIKAGSPGRIETTRVEIGYLDGLERLEDPGPVSLIISAEDIQVSELIPGSRAVRIPISSVLEAGAVDASVMVPGKRVRPRWWWWLAFGPLAALFPGKRTPDTKEHDYVLTITYRIGDEVRTAVFHREDRTGLSVVEGLARIVTSLVRSR